ncbi:LVIVD repeat-containing protein [Halorientalis brevis]|uniref:LVIVD repeat-containing protein n=1 Tax=Halorientalis brevis TaxID=1126241 RepID=A0ABD6CDL3_9EURY|nr:hypothetical protein [Halorientalis brevis]
MRRRQFVSASVGVSLGSGVAIGAPSTRSRPTADAFAPLGTVAVDGIKEAVVGPDGTTVYAAATDGFATIDVADPANPTVLADRRNLLADRASGPLSQIYDAKVDGDRLVVVGPANPKQNALNAAIFYDVSDPADPQRLGVHETSYPIHNCYFADGVAYLSANRYQRNGLTLVEVGDEPTQVGSWSLFDRSKRWGDVWPGLWPVHDVYVQDDRAYLAHWDAGTWIVDVSDPRSPSLLSQVRGRSADALASLGQAQSGLEALQPPGNDHYVAVDEDASVLGIGIESWDAEQGDGRGGPGGVELWDVSDPTAPSRLSTIAPPPSSDPRYSGEWTTSHNFQFAGDHLYTSWYQGGIKVFDVSDPASPTEVAAWRDSEAASFWNAQVATEAIVAPSGIDRRQDVTITDRLYTFPIPDAAAASLRGNETATETGTGTGAGSTTDASGPGFDVTAALAGLGIEAWRRRR